MWEPGDDNEVNRFQGLGNISKEWGDTNDEEEEKRLCQAQSLPVALKPRTRGWIFILGFRDPLGVCRFELQMEQRALTRAL